MKVDGWTGRLLFAQAERSVLCGRAKNHAARGSRSDLYALGGILHEGWAFQLFYWDYVIGIIGASLLSGFTLGSAGGGELSFLRNIGGADATHIIFALLGGVAFNLANLLVSRLRYRARH
jgi:hypothetical protein